MCISGTWVPNWFDLRAGNLKFSNGLREQNLSKHVNCIWQKARWYLVLSFICWGKLRPHTWELRVPCGGLSLISPLCLPLAAAHITAPASEPILLRFWYRHIFQWISHGGIKATYRQLGGLVVKTLACCAGGPGIDPRAGNPKFSRDLHQQNPSWMSFGWDVKLAVPCTSVYAGQVKDPTHGVNV